MALNDLNGLKLRYFEQWHNRCLKYTHSHICFSVIVKTFQIKIDVLIYMYMINEFTLIVIS